MTRKEFQNLRRLELSIRRYSSFRNVNRPSKRSVKRNGNGIGQWLRGSRVRAECHIEKVFINKDKQ